MDKRIVDVFNDRYDNYILPFYWQKGDHTEKIPEQIQRIYDSNIRAFCVESRPHKDFCGDGWWRDMDLILAEAEKRSMKVWILDDDHFPTGHANGYIQHKFPELRRVYIVETHIDLYGPMQDAAAFVRKYNSDDELIGAFAYRRTCAEEEIEDKPIDLTANISNSMLYWDVPEGVWRVFFLLKHRDSLDSWLYIDNINRESSRVLIDAVYEPHYKRYARYFGNTIAGFFSDEPLFGNDFIYEGRKITTNYEKTVGLPGMAMPWSDEVLSMMSKALGRDALQFLPAIWYDMVNIGPKVRLEYMNAVTKLYRDNFTRQLGDWCAEHSVMYIGHIVEDMNASTRLACSAGHYFRAVDGQDMSGIDIVLHQIIPGLSEHIHPAISYGNVSDPEFYNYVLAKLCSSDSHTSTRKKGRAMCEVFGAYGWAEGTQTMKWLMDHLLVRGVNNFVPHAFSPQFPDNDSPPHFGAEGFDPQFEGFGQLMSYTNKISHILSESNHVATAALLYHAEGEWMSREDYMFVQKPAKVLLDSHIDYDILCVDTLMNASVKNGKLAVNKEKYECLVIPYAKRLPDYFLSKVNDLQKLGVRVFFIDGVPLNCDFDVTVVSNCDIAQVIIKAGMNEISVNGNCPLLRHYHCTRGGANIFMFFNESVVDDAVATINLPCRGQFLKLDIMNGNNSVGFTDDGSIDVKIEPYVSQIFVFDNFDDEFLKEFKHQEKTTVSVDLNPTYHVFVADYKDMSNLKFYGEFDKLFNICSPSHLPEFSGRIVYEAKFDCCFDTEAVLDLGVVGQVAKVWLNGEYCGMKICNPYTFDIGKAVVKGENELRIEVFNTLANSIKDNFSMYLQLAPSGLLGPVSILS